MRIWQPELTGDPIGRYGVGYFLLTESLAPMCVWALKCQWIFFVANIIFILVTLIIRDQLVNPPTWFSSFRDLTLYYSIFVKDDVILESNDPDIYVKWLRSRGGMDFVEDIISIGTEDGIRLDIEYNYPRSIVVDRISPENIQMLINRLKSLR